MGADLLESTGLDLLRRYGWSVIAIGSEKKPPEGMRWKRFQTTRPTEAELRSMFRRPGLQGLAVILGSVSGDLWARDFDKAEAFPKWAAAFPDLKLPTVTTAKGFHVYGVWPGVRFADLGDGELRAGGGCYCMLPPSRHPTGPPYSWATPPAVTIPRLDPATVGLDRPWDSDVTKALRLLGSQAPRLSDPKASSGIENGEVGPELAGDVADELLMQAIPDGPGQNHKSLFELARRVRGLEEAAGGKYSLAALRAAFAASREPNRNQGILF